MPGILDFLTGGATPLVEAVGKIATDLITTDKERIQLGLQQQELDQKGDLAQIDVNKTEAQSSMMFVAGWRPAVGWVGAVSLGVAYIPKCLMLTGLWSYQASVLVYNWHIGTPMPALPPFPDLGLTDILGLLGSMLGMGYMRHREKLAGVAATGILAASPAKGVSESDLTAP
jgi:hypothetical protein